MNKPTIRVIVVNPIAQTIEAVDMPNDFAAMKRDYIKCDLAEPVDLGSNVDAWVDEEGMLKDWDSQGFTKLCGGINTLAGTFVLVGRSEIDNSMVDLPSDIDPEFVEIMCTFISAKKVKVPGIKITTQNPDGSTSTTACGPDSLTYDDH